MSQPTICTIIAKNYLAQARCLTHSFLTQHPNGRVFVLVVDQLEGYFDPSQERFETVKIDEIGIKDWVYMTYRYTMLELSTAVKPFFLEYLFRQFELDKICYFDPDIYFYKPIDEIWDMLNSYSIVLTPHLVDFLEDEFRPNELNILQSGSYNLGFIGVSKTFELDRSLHWWQRKVIKYCVVAIEQGLFVDQKWMDLAPSLFTGVYIHRDPGCNVAYWNLNHRHVACENGEYTVNGSPLKFFHFSGFSPDRMDVLSKHQNRFTFQDLPNVKPLFEGYRDCLLTHDYATVKNWPYTYTYENDLGVRIPDVGRTLWEDWRTSSSPLSSLEQDNLVNDFTSWLNQPVDEDSDPDQPAITRLAYAVHQHRPDLQRGYPDVLGADRRRYIRWFLSRAKVELGVDEYFIQPMRDQRGALLSLRGLTERLHSLGSRAYMGFANWLFQIGVGPWLEQTLGEQFINRIRGFFMAPAQQVVPRPSPASSKPNIRGASIGLNVVGYLCDETGVGEVARSCLKALYRQGYPTAYTMVSSQAARKNDFSALYLQEGHPYLFNCLFVNADQVEVVYNELGPEFFAGKCNIGYWHWELNQFPEEWLNRFEYFHEIWVASSFVQNTLAHISPIPVLTMGAPVEGHPNPGITRSQLGLPEDQFLFLFVFDMWSYIERKNPFGLIEAYRRAFGSRPRDTTLVIKVANLDQFAQCRAPLQEAVDSVSGILIDGYLDREALDALFHVADAYASLHRSEGFGLTMAEAMYLGKPVIGTSYSSNTDFMNVSNSYPVEYHLVELEQDYGPYKKGAIWADPDLDHAAAQMRCVFENPDEATRVGTQGAADVQRMFSSDAISRRIIGRLNRVLSWSQ
jgi:glycosyltransferase involved in cell wall biosynthesis